MFSIVLSAQVTGNRTLNQDGPVHGGHAITTTGSPVTFTAVAEAAQIARATLYRNRELRAVIDDHRTRQTDARTLTGLATEVAQLRGIVETLANTVTAHEERLRRLSPRNR